MIIVGLGSNTGNRLENLRLATNLMTKSNTTDIHAFSPIYRSQALLDQDAPEEWNQDFLNTALACTSKLSPLEFLNMIKDIEKSMGRVSLGHWGPRIIDIDILAWDEYIVDEKALQIPHPRLLERPFALWPLADLVPRWMHPKTQKTAAELIRPWGSRFSGGTLLQTRQIRQSLKGTKLVGVLNITPNSFSDGGLLDTSDKAVEQIEQLVAQGAEIIDIGAEATSQYIWTTHSKETPQDIEWQRLSPILHALPDINKNLAIKPIISIDTRNAKTAEKCLDMHVDWINDVTGLEHHDMQALIREYPKAHWVMMHHLGVPPSLEQHLPWEKDPIALLKTFAEKRLEHLLKQGASLDKIIFDPGIGFGKTQEQSLEILQRIEELNSLKLPLLIGHSRKMFLSLFTDHAPQQRDNLTLIASQYLVQKNVDYLRVHNVAAHGELLAWQAKTSPTT